MKKTLLLLILCLALTGCNPLGRRPSDDFVPADANQLPSTYETSARPSAPAETHAQPPAAVGEARVKVTLDREGEYDRSRELIRYRYRVPYLDFPTEYANQCNLEIERLFYVPAEESLEEMEQYRPPIVQTVDFTTDVHGDVLSVRVNRLDVDGSLTPAVYSIHAETGEAVSPEQFLAAVGLEDQDPIRILTNAVQTRFESKYAGRYSASDLEYTTALSRTLEPLAQPGQLRMYLTEAGALHIAVELFDPRGGSTVEEISLP